ncbi:MAG: DUF2807 domain-containing protein [Gammaproteobacteria bacterium]|jgi:hypothetical protein
MKTSNKILIFGIIGCIAILLVIAIIFRMNSVSSNFINMKLKSFNNIQHNTIESKLSDFDGITVLGPWNVTIKQGEKYNVKITASKNIINKLEVVKDGNILLLSIKPGYGFFSDYNVMLRAEITTPKLSSIISKGSSNINFSGFNSKNLEIHLAGSGNIVGKDNEIQNLATHLAGSGNIIGKNNKIENFVTQIAGSGNVKFTDSTITNADVHIAGSGDVYLGMNGGNLSGKIAGSGDIIIYGKVKQQSIRILGSGDVKYR